MKIDPKDLTRRQRHLLLGNLIVPRPIALVSTISGDGILNLAPFAMFGIVCYHPAMVYFAPMRREWEGVLKKDTLVNVEQTGEFVVNMVTEDIAERMNVTDVAYPSEVDEFQVSGLTPVSSDLVKPPRVAESPVNLECHLNQMVHFGEPPREESMIIGEVLRIHAKDELYRDGIVDTTSLRFIGRMGWGLYVRTTDLFEMKPKKSRHPGRHGGEDKSVTEH